MSENERLRDLLEDALGMLRAIESTHSDEKLRELAGNAYSEISAQLCELAAEPDRRELQAEGTHPPPCARYCEALAFSVEIQQLKNRIAELEAKLAAPVTPAETRKDLPSPARVTGELLYKTYPGFRGAPWECGMDQALWNDWAEQLNTHLARGERA